MTRTALIVTLAVGLLCLIALKNLDAILNLLPLVE